MPKVLNKDEILKADDCQVKAVEVPEWGGTIYIRTMSAKERDLFEAEVYNNGKVQMNNLRSKLCVLCLSDEKGNRLFELKDIEALGKKSGKVLNKIFLIAQKVNGFGRDDLEEMAKNSGAGQSEGSTSD